jgi:hypothetical protein
MFDYPPVEYILALLGRYHSLRVDAKMKSVKIITPSPTRSFIETRKAFKLPPHPHLDFDHPLFFNSQADRFAEIG